MPDSDCEDQEEEDARLQDNEPFETGCSAIVLDEDEDKECPQESTTIAKWDRKVSTQWTTCFCAALVEALPQ